MFLLKMNELTPFWLLTLFLVVLVLVSVLGNLLVVLAVKTDKSLRKLSNLFLVNLAIADLLVMLTLSTFIIVVIILRSLFLSCPSLLLMI